MTETEEWITYHLDLPRGSCREYRVSVLTGLARRNEAQALPQWTNLSHHRCKHCTLDDKRHSQCPLAASLVDLVADWSDATSHDSVHLNVITAHRQITADTTMQRALSSLLGLVMATSACPSMGFFRPMARYHLPVSTHEETMFRVVSTYLLARYFMNGSANSDVGFESLLAIYRDLREINIQIAKRIQDGGKNEATTNAVVLLHVLTCVLPSSMEDSLQELRMLFGPAVGQLRLAELERDAAADENSAPT